MDIARFATRVWAALVFAAAGTLAALPGPDWLQWGGNPQHTGFAPVAGQPLTAILADVVVDPFFSLELAEEGGDGVLVHYPVPLIDRDDVYVELKSGSYIPCDPPDSGEPFPCGADARDSEVWNVMKLSWRNGTLLRQWTFSSDWKPEPNGGGAQGWEPVFHPVLSGDFLWVPGLGGTVHKVSKATGLEVAVVNPFPDLNPSRYVAGGLAADATGRVVYDAIELDPSDPWNTDVVGAWLVRIAPDGFVTKAEFAALAPQAPRPTDLCQGDFANSQKPWPPTPTAVPPSSPCGSQRPGINVVPAIAPDGTIYTVSRAHLNERYGYLIAVHPDLSPAWAASLRGILNDGCGITLPIDNDTGCRTGTTVGVDPRTNDRPAGRVIDRQTSSPVVLPDGAVLYGPKTFYNEGSGHLFKFGPDGSALATYDAGFDLTPAVYEHDGTYSIKVKHNFFGPPDIEQYYIVSVDANLVPEWTFVNRNTRSCARQQDGTISCVDDHPDGFEWCVNQPAVDAAGITYANSDDGHLYAIDQAGQLHDDIFLDLAIGAAYTPVAIGPDGRIYAQNNGHLLAVGIPVVPRAAPEPRGGARPGTRTIARP